MLNAYEVIIRTMFDAHQRLDKDVAATILTDDFTFGAPPDPPLDRAQYFEKFWPSGEGQSIRTYCIKRMLFGESDAFVTYEVEGMNGETFKNANYFVFEGDKIKHIDVYFGQ
jgi:hypothetical protein